MRAVVALPLFFAAESSLFNLPSVALNRNQAVRVAGRADAFDGEVPRRPKHGRTLASAAGVLMVATIPLVIRRGVTSDRLRFQWQLLKRRICFNPFGRERPIFNPSTARFLVASQGGETKGFAESQYLDPENEKAGIQLSNLVVDETETQGEVDGQLVKRLVEDASGSVWVMARKSSKEFYQDLGFAEAEPPAAVKKTLVIRQCVAQISDEDPVVCMHHGSQAWHLPAEMPKLMRQLDEHVRGAEPEVAAALASTAHAPQPPPAPRGRSRHSLHSVSPKKKGRADAPAAPLALAASFASADPLQRRDRPQRHSTPARERSSFAPELHAPLLHAPQLHSPHLTRPRPVEHREADGKLPGMQKAFAASGRPTAANGSEATGLKDLKDMARSCWDTAVSLSADWREKSELLLRKMSAVAAPQAELQDFDHDIELEGAFRGSVAAVGATAAHGKLLDKAEASARLAAALRRLEALRAAGLLQRTDGRWRSEEVFAAVREFRAADAAVEASQSLDVLGASQAWMSLEALGAAAAAPIAELLAEAEQKSRDALAEKVREMQRSKDALLTSLAAFPAQLVDAAALAVRNAVEKRLEAAAAELERAPAKSWQALASMWRSQAVVAGAPAADAPRLAAALARLENLKVAGELPRTDEAFAAVAEYKAASAAEAASASKPHKHLAGAGHVSWSDAPATLSGVVPRPTLSVTDSEPEPAPELSAARHAPAAAPARLAAALGRLEDLKVDGKLPRTDEVFAAVAEFKAAQLAEPMLAALGRLENLKVDGKLPQTQEVFAAVAEFKAAQLAEPMLDELPTPRNAAASSRGAGFGDALATAFSRARTKADAELDTLVEAFKAPLSPRSPLSPSPLSPRTLAPVMGPVPGRGSRVAESRDAEKNQAAARHLLTLEAALKNLEDMKVGGKLPRTDEAIAAAAAFKVATAAAASVANTSAATDRFRHSVSPRRAAPGLSRQSVPAAGVRPQSPRPRQPQALVAEARGHPSGPLLHGLM